MVSDFVIKQAIENLVAGNYTIWNIGITDNPERSRGKLGNPKEWYHWNANSKTKAKVIQIYFRQRGMREVGEVGQNPSYVFIFLK